MYTALYYPHTTIGDSPLLKTALLLWDDLEFIVPWSGYKIASADNNSVVDEALEIIAKKIQPTYEQKTYAHTLIEDLATSNLPKDFLMSPIDKNEQYLIFDKKFLSETWNVIRQANLAVPEMVGEYTDWATSQCLGLTMMSILAEACAGTQKRRVTDRTSAYELLNQSIAQLHGGEYDNVPDIDTFEKLVTISLQIIDTDQFTLQELIDFRKREKNENNGHHFTKLRHNYLDTIDGYVKSIGEVKGNETDIAEIENDFKKKLKEDLGFLKDGLKKSATDTLLSKEVGFGIIATAGMAITPWTGLLGVGALIKTAKNYREDRKKILREHAMSWLFSMKSGDSFFGY